MERIDLHVESLIFAAENPVSSSTLKATLDRLFEVDFDEEDIEAAIDRIQEKYSSDDFPFSVEEIDGAFVFMTKPIYHETVGALLKEQSNSKLTKVALETLSIIAYKQPVTKTFIEGIRGVNSDYTVQKLLEKGLIEISGRAEGPGKPLLYATSKKFMDYFGLKSHKDLPTLKEISKPEEEIGKPSDIEIVEEE